MGHAWPALPAWPAVWVVFGVFVICLAYVDSEVCVAYVICIACGACMNPVVCGTRVDLSVYVAYVVCASFVYCSWGDGAEKWLIDLFIWVVFYAVSMCEKTLSSLAWVQGTTAEYAPVFIRPCLLCGYIFVHILNMSRFLFPSNRATKSCPYGRHLNPVCWLGEGCKRSFSLITELFIVTLLAGWPSMIYKKRHFSVPKYLLTRWNRADSEHCYASFPMRRHN